MSDIEYDNSFEYPWYVFIHITLFILSVISVCNVSSTEAELYGLYDYLRYNVNRLIIIAVIFGIQLINCILLISKRYDATREELYIIITKISGICYIITTLVFTYYLIAINDSAKTMSYNKTGNTYMDMMQIVSFIIIILDYILTIPVALGCCGCWCYSIDSCFCKQNPLIISCCKSLFDCCKNMFLYIPRLIDSYKKNIKKEIKFLMMDGSSFILNLSMNQSIKEVKDIITNDAVELFIKGDEEPLNDDDILYDKLDLLKSVDNEIFLLQKSEVTFNPIVNFETHCNNETKSKRKCCFWKQNIIYL